MPVPWGAIGLGVGVGGNLLGGFLGAGAARTQAMLANEAAERRLKYETDAWKMNSRALIANRAQTVDEIAMKARNEGRRADYTDAMNARQYQRELQIRDLENSANQEAYQRSEEIYTSQLDLNNASFQAAYESEQRNLQEIQTEQAFDKQEAWLETLLKEGQMRSLGLSGRTAAKGGQVTAADFGRQIAQLNEGFASAGRNAQAIFRELALDKSSADLAAFSSRMLQPGELPLPLEALPTPRAEFIYPRALEEFDFGPRPVMGAQVSPGAAAAQVWGSAISGIAGTFSSYAFSKGKK